MQDDAGDRLFAEDLLPGATFDLGSRRVDAEDIIEFATQWDPLPFHVNAEHAKVGHFGGLIASGVHTFAVFQRLQVDALLSRTAIYAGYGADRMRLPNPVRPGDLLFGTAEVMRAQDHTETTVRLTMAGTLANQIGQTVLHLTSQTIVFRRKTASE
jgi:acyl dehydratase